MTVADVIVSMIIIVWVGLVIIIKRSSSGSLDKTITRQKEKKTLKKTES
jgi:hypothetical protein